MLNSRLTGTRGRLDTPDPWSSGASVGASRPSTSCVVLGAHMYRLLATAVRPSSTSSLHARWHPPTPRIPNASCEPSRVRPRFRPLPGSIDPAHRRLLPNFNRRLSHSP